LLGLPTVKGMQIIEHSVIGTRAAVLRMRRRGTGLEFVIFPMLHVAAPEFYSEVTRRLKLCDVLVVEGVGANDGDRRSARGTALVLAVTLTYRVIPWLRRGTLVRQRIDYRSLGIPCICPDVTTEDIAGSFGRTPWRFRVMLLLTLPVGVVVNLFGGHRRILSPDVEVNDLPSPDDEEFEESEFGEQFEELFVGDRDDRVAAVLADLVRTRGAERLDAGVVYGAGHTTAIVDALFKLGYRLRPSDWIMLMPA
jgi:hypothetical protein